MAEIGLTDQGFVPQTLEEIREEIETDLREQFGRSLPLGDKSVLGFLVGIVAERFHVHWETDQALYSQMDPDAAVSTMLASVCKFTGTFRREGSSSVALVTLCGDDGTPVALGFIVATESTGKRFLSVSDVELVALDPWVAATAYVVGDRVTNDDHCYVCVLSGVSDGAGGPSTTDPEVDIDDNTAKWRYLGEGTAAVDAIVAAEDVGPTIAVAFDLTEIQSPVGGVNTALNRADATIGRVRMTDEQLRLQRESDLSAPGTSPSDAIRSALLAIDGVTSVTIFMNLTDRIDADGVPPHSLEAMIQGGEDQTIFDTLWTNVAGGIRTHGDVTGTSFDSSGRAQPMSFSRPDEIDIHVALEVTVDPLTFPADGIAQIKAAVATRGNEGEAGLNAVASRASSWAFEVEGVSDVTETLIGTVDPPVAATTIPISKRQRAVFDTANVDVSITNEEP